jgi:hypothetical protein
VVLSVGVVVVVVVVVVAAAVVVVVVVLVAVAALSVVVVAVVMVMVVTASLRLTHLVARVRVLEGQLESPDDVVQAGIVLAPQPHAGAGDGADGALHGLQRRAGSEYRLRDRAGDSETEDAGGRDAGRNQGREGRKGGGEREREERRRA